MSGVNEPGFTPSIPPQILAEQGSSAFRDHSNLLDWVKQQLISISGNLQHIDKTVKEGSIHILQTITDLDETVGNNRASIKFFSELLVTKTEAMARIVADLTAETHAADADLLATLHEEIQVRTTLYDALSKYVLDLNASIETVSVRSSAEVNSLRQAYVTHTTALAQVVDATSVTLETKISLFRQTTAPSSTDRVFGDVWIDTDDNNKVYVWTGSAWTDSTTHDMVVFAQNSPPTTTVVGALWIDTDDDNKLYRWDGAAWQLGAAFASAVSSLVSKIDQRARTFWQATAPPLPDPTLNAGDIWIDIDDNYRFYMLIGGAWVDSTAANMLVFSQTAPPSTTVAGALWIDTDDDNKLYRWNGSTWVEITDGRLTSISGSYTNVSAQAAGGSASGAVYLEAIASPPTGYSAWYGWRIQAGPSNFVGMRAMVTSAGAAEIAFYASQLKIIDPSFNGGLPMTVMEYTGGAFYFFVPVIMRTHEIDLNAVTELAASRSATGVKVVDESLIVPDDTYISIQGDYSGETGGSIAAPSFGTLYITNAAGGGGSTLQMAQNNWVRDASPRYFIGSSYISTEVGPLTAGTYSYSVVSTDSMTNGSTGGTVGIILTAFKR